jgi:uncharacterized membrane protein YdjX (TVP38/TMEM64 family)
VTSRLSPTVRIVLLVVLVVSLAAAAHFSGIASSLTRDRIAQFAEAWGLLGVAAYVAMFAIAEVMQLPGAIFVIAAVAAYGPWLGTLVAYVGMNVASIAVFAFGRLVAGRALAEVSHPRVKALMAEIERAPIRTTVLARGVFFVLPGIGYALALSPVRWRDYVIGSAIGLVVPSLLAAVLGEWALSLASG